MMEDQFLPCTYIVKSMAAVDCGMGIDFVLQEYSSLSTRPVNILAVEHKYVPLNLLTF